MEKVLIITYYWPPAGGPGVQRWLKFVKYLKAYNVEPIVYIPENPEYPLIDESLQDEIPEGISILKKKIFEPYQLAQVFSKKDTSNISSGIIPETKKQTTLQKLFLYIRGNFFIPDARKFWIKPSVKYLSKYISENDIKTVITTGPPHSLHLIGLKIKSNLPITWIADFRDPWTQIGYHKKLKLSSASKRKHLNFEHKVLNTADTIITTSYTTKAEFREKTSKPITVITNGYDETLIKEVVPDANFTLAHIGSLLSGRNPYNLWEVLSQLISENELFAKKFKLKLVGAVSKEVLETINSFGLQNNLEVVAYVTHQEALKIQRQSQVLLLIEIDSIETRGIIPGKIFEYLAAKRPILAIGPEQWDVIRILEHTNSGKYYSYQDTQQLKSQILTYFNLYQDKELRSSSKNIEEYSRKMLTGKLANLIKNI
ncbi:glycosyltransferase family 4 protein [Gillisia sp. M10.2A]|uniref:Glycosyltransferase family 4 protein n=1 Tax=Gillisia lutea TaxID=2909668 RepID=A0ABS9EF30_9FLAO|nr:glycosyltransferase family 4 protein [Gillisia lutea]MCF4101480.1 glycosyltransferase family 4 protein [Gillisia lutea]